MRKMLLALTFALLATVPAASQQITPTTQFTIPIAAGTLTETKIVSGITGKSIYVTQISQVAAAGAVVTYTTGTGTNCGTSNAALTGAMTFAAAQTLVAGTGNGAILVVPSSFDLCLTIATAGAPGFLSYAQW